MFVVFVVYSALVYAECDGTNKAPRPDRHVLAGWQIWQSKNCQSCHQLYGLGGYMGPDLTNVASDSLKGAAYMHVFIQYGTGRMPNFHLQDSAINDLIAFLSWVDKSGRSAVREQAVQWDGNYDLHN